MVTTSNRVFSVLMPGTSALLAAIFLWLKGKKSTLFGTFFLWRWRFFAHSKTSQMLYHSDFLKDTIPHKFRFVFCNRSPPNLTNSSSFDKCCKSCVTLHPAFWTCLHNSNPTPDAYAPAKDGLCNGARQKNHKTIKNKCLQGLPNDKISLFLHPVSGKRLA